MRQLMIAIVVGACLGSTAAEEGRDLKSLVSPQTLSCELWNVRLTRDIVEISSGISTVVRGTDTTTGGITKEGMFTSTDDRAHHSGAKANLKSEFTAEGGYKFGVGAYGSVGGRVSIEGSVEGAISSTSAIKSHTMETVSKSWTVKQEKEVAGSDKFSLGKYKLKFTVILDNQDSKNGLTIDCSKMIARLWGRGLTGEISVSYSEHKSNELGVGLNFFEFVYPINDEKEFEELKRLNACGQLGQLNMYKSSADIPVMSKDGENVLSKQIATELRRPSTAVLVDIERYRGLPSWRVSRYHTAQSGRQGTNVTLREAFQGIELAALDYRDTLKAQTFEFVDGALVKVLDDAVINEDKDGQFHMFALRMKDKAGKTSLGLPSADNLALSIDDYSEIALISFSFEEFAKWAVRYPRHFADFKKQIQDRLADIADKKVLRAFEKQIEDKQHEEDVRPLDKYTVITKDDVDRFRERAEVGVPEMQYKFARCLLEGWCISKNEAESVKWFRKAAEQGNADGQFWLGYCYMCGIGGAKKEAEAFSLYHRAAKQGHSDAKANIKLREMIDSREISNAAEILTKRINADISRTDIYGIIFWIEELATKLRGGKTDLAVKKFTPPDPDLSYKKVMKELESSKDNWFKNFPGPLTGLGVNWENDAQRCVVTAENLNRTTLLSEDKIQEELARFERVVNIVAKLNNVVDSRYKNEGADFITVKNSLSSIKERLKTNKTRFLSYEVVSPYLYEAHCHLFAGIKEGRRVSSFDWKFPDKTKYFKSRGIWLLNVISDHKEWLDSCAQEVREQYREIRAIYGEKIREQ